MFDRFFLAYVTCALWSSNDNADDSGGAPLDRNYSAEDIAPEAMNKMRADCLRFYDENFEFIADDIERAGHDFWLTRNGHGAGFWDGDWPEFGDLLTERSKQFGETDLYLGDDCQIYAYPGN